MLIAFLHQMGYTYFDIPKLTLQEIDALVRGYNRLTEKTGKGK